MSINGKIIALISAASVFVFSLIAFVDWQRINRSLEAVFIREAFSMSRGLETALTNSPALNLDEMAFAAIQRAMMSDQNLVSVVISTPSASGLAPALSNDMTKAPATTSPLALFAFEEEREVHQIYEDPFGEPRLAVAKPLYIARRPVAAVQLDYSMVQTRQQAYETFLGDLAILAIMMSCLSMLLYVITRRIVVLPINRLTRSVDRFAETGQLAISSSKGNDEIGTLSTSFENMATSLIDAQDKQNQVSRLEAVGQLTGGIAHDFNNLLQIILSSAEVLEEMLNDPDKREVVEDITGAAIRGSELTSRLLSFSQKQILSPVVFSLHDEGEEIAKLLRRALEPSFEFKWDVQKDLWTFADRGQFENALINLAINARDAMGEGGTLRLHIRERALSTQDLLPGFEVDPGDYVVVEVIDTGEGIPEPVLSRVYEPFFTTKAVGKGSGLGLSMVFGFVRQSKGQMKIESEVGAGTTVTLYLPKADPPAGNVREAQAEPAPPGSPKRILLVEDEAALRTMLARHLAREGHNVEIAPDGHTALELLTQHPAFEVLVSDVALPGNLNGIEVYQRALEMQPDLKCVLISGHLLEQTDHFQGKVPILKKPFSLAEFSETLSKLDG